MIGEAGNPGHTVSVRSSSGSSLIFPATVFLTAAIIGIAAAVSQAESLPLFISADHGAGDARETKAHQPLWFEVGDPSWQPRIQPRGDLSGETTVRVRFPVPAKKAPIRFGIPLGQVPSARNVALFDDAGREIPADVFPLVNFDTSALNWVLIAAVLDARVAGEAELTIHWGPEVKRSDPQRQIRTVESDTEVQFAAGAVEFTLSGANLISDIRSSTGQQFFGATGGRVGFEIKGRPTANSAPLGVYRQERDEAAIVKLFDGPHYKRYRVSSRFFHSQRLNRPFRLHFEVETWADSPYLMVHSRFINETFKETMSDLVLFAFAPGGANHTAAVSGVDEDEFSGGTEMSVRQRRDEWVVRADGADLARGLENDLGEWARIARDGEAVTLVVPDFQGFGPAEPDLESVLSATAGGGLELRHYSPLNSGTNTGGTITFWNSAARTFRMALHAGPDSLSGPAVAVPIRQLPSIQYDRAFLTSQGTFAEDRVTRIYDQVTLEGTRYFDRARALRQDYPRLGRGMPPQKGEGFEKPFTNTGGMLFGEVWQYMEPNGAWNKSWIPKQKSEGNLPHWYEPVDRAGFATYRVGDHSMAMAYSYLRTGDRQVFEIFRDHSLLYADWAVSHPTGSVHYYANWTGKPHVYVRLAGPIIAYLVDGDPWLLETAEQMGAYLVRQWNGKNPSDRESRSAYPIRGLTWLYEVTGHRGYWNDAVDRVLWFIDGALTDSDQVRGVVRENDRLSMLYAGYALVGLSNVHERTENESLLASMKRVGDWLIQVQGKYDGPFTVNTGTWAADEKRGSRTMVGPGNVGTTTLCAEVQSYLAQVTGEQRYFYSGAAAWANIVTASRHNWIKGGLPMQTENRWRTGTWSDKLAPYLHRMPALATKHGWPFVVEGVFDPNAAEGQTVVVFVGAEGRFENDTLVQPMFAGNKEPVRIPLWSSATPTEMRYNGEAIEFSTRNGDGVTYLTLPGEAEPGILEVRFRGTGNTSVKSHEAGLPGRFVLEQNYPNPFNGGTVIPFAVPDETEIALEVYNLAGQRLVTLRHGPVQPGRHEVHWNGRHANGRRPASGLYLYRLCVGQREQVRKLLLIQ